MDRKHFNDSVMARDHNKCVVCGAASTAVHHIMERVLWDDGGYHTDNGVCLCDDHHLKAEQTLISCDELRELAGIKSKVLPGHLDPDGTYDKWGNPYINKTTRVRGELFYNENVQKILSSANVLSDFLERVKYPKTLHLPWSEGLQNDDRMLQSFDGLEGEEVVVTVKLDGENCFDQLTTIETEAGSKTIKELCENNYSGLVKGVDENTGLEILTPVQGRLISSAVEDWIEITLEDNTTLTVTPEQRIWVVEINGYKQAKELTSKDTLLQVNPSQNPV